VNKKTTINTTLTLCLLLTTLSNLVCQTESKSTSPNTPRSLYTIGYQIGGHTYIGASYEYKIIKLLGFHAGVGFSGYTAGLKFHMSDCVECPQLNISFKDGEFGSIGTIGAEFASRMFTFKKNGKLAAYAQFGFGYITYLSDEKREELYGSKDAPEGIFTFGIGLNFW
jgi:hypothetical protein